MIEAGVFILKEREIRREIERELVRQSDEEMKDDLEALALNGDPQQVSSSRFSSLLASKDRDYLLSPNGAQVLSHSLSVDLSRDVLYGLKYRFLFMLQILCNIMGDQMKHISSLLAYLTN